MAQTDKPRKATKAQSAPVAVVQLPEPVEQQPEYEPRHLSSEEDLQQAVKTVAEIIADLERAAAVEGNLEFGDEKMDGHRKANVKALNDCIAKLETAQKRHGWVKAWYDKATRAAEKEAAAEKRRAEKAAAAAAKQAKADAAAKAKTEGK